MPITSPAILGFFEEPFHEFSEEARTRGFASLGFPRFAFVVNRCGLFIRLAAGKNLIVNIIGLFQATSNVRFGSLAVVHHHITPIAAFGRKAAVPD